MNLAETTNAARVQATSATFTGPDATRFYVQFSNNCLHQTFFQGNSCSFGIAMHAAPPGTYTANLEVTNDGNTSPLSHPAERNPVGQVEAHRQPGGGRLRRGRCRPRARADH